MLLFIFIEVYFYFYCSKNNQNWQNFIISNSDFVLPNVTEVLLVYSLKKFTQLNITL